MSVDCLFLTFALPTQNNESDPCVPEAGRRGQALRLHKIECALAGAK